MPRGRNPRPKDIEGSRSPLWKFAFAGDVAGVQRELDGGADINGGDIAGITPLHIAIQEKRADVIELLIRSGANVNQPDKHGNVPLWTAVQNWDRTNNILRLLLLAGADPRIANHFGSSPLEVIAGIKGEIAEIVAERFGGQQTHPV